MVSQVYTYVKTHQIVHFKYVQFIVCQSYLKKLFKKESYIISNIFSPSCPLSLNFIYFLDHV